MILTILASQVIFSFDQYPIDLRNEVNLEILNIIIALIFTCELCIRLTSLGFEDFFRGNLINKFDSIITLTCIVDIVCSWTIFYHEMLINSWGITILRATRAIRFFKLARYWDSFSLLLENLYETLLNIKTYALLLVIILYIYVLLGLAFFGYRARINHATLELDPDHGHSPLYHFDTMMQSIFTTFVIFTNDGQSIIFYNFYRAVSPSLATLWWLTFVIITQKMLLNLFLAILLEKFEEADTRQKMVEDE
jgi:hypothetical protein